PKDRTVGSFADSQNSFSDAEADSPVHSVHGVREIRAFLRVSLGGGRVQDGHFAPRARLSVPDLYRALPGPRYCSTTGICGSNSGSGRSGSSVFSLGGILSIASTTDGSMPSSVTTIFRPRPGRSSGFMVHLPPRL